MEAIVEQVSHVEGEQAPSVRQAIADRSVNDPEPIATGQDITCKPILELSLLIDVGSFEPRPEA